MKFKIHNLDINSKRRRRMLHASCFMFHERGFTLVELIIYIVIVSIVLMFAVGFGLEIIQGKIKADSAREVQQNSRIALERITNQIRRASGVTEPTIGLSSSKLQLTMASGASPVVFEAVSGVLYVTEGVGGTPYPLTSSDVIVSSIDFQNASYVSTHPQIFKIDMTIDHKNPGGRQEYSSQIVARATAALRQ